MALRAQSSHGQSFALSFAKRNPQRGDEFLGENKEFKGRIKFAPLNLPGAFGPITSNAFGSQFLHL